eukprot:PhF_6_TR40363/c0_g1_i1/m.60068
MQSFTPHSRLTRLVMWSSKEGARWWGKICIREGPRGRGLYSTQHIPTYDFALAVPVKSTFSFLNFETEENFPLRVLPSDYHLPLPWWPDLDWGTFSLMIWLTKNYILHDQSTAPYLMTLPRDEHAFPVLRSIAKQAIRSTEYRDSVKPVAAMCRVPEEVFDENVLWMYCMIRSRSIPLWSKQGQGHPYFEQTKYATVSQDHQDVGEVVHGDVACMVPLLDMVNHSHQPNATIGIPDQQMMEYLSTEGEVESPHVFVLQAMREIKAGEELVVDWNTNYGFDKDVFNAWFDTPYVDLQSMYEEDAKTRESREGSRKKRKRQLAEAAREASLTAAENTIATSTFTVTHAERTDDDDDDVPHPEAT